MVRELPPSLKTSPNIDWRDQTVEQLVAERDYWQSKIDDAGQPGMQSPYLSILFVK